MGRLAVLWFIAYPALFILLPALGGATGGAGGAFAGALGSIALAGLFWPWLIGLFVLGLLALITRPRPRLEVRLPAPPVDSARPVEPAPSTKVCPMCAETVMGAARICRYCGHLFGEPSDKPVGASAEAVPPPASEVGGAPRPADPATPGHPAAAPAGLPGDSSARSDARVPAGPITAVQWPRLSRQAWAAGVALVAVIAFFATTTLLGPRDARRSASPQPAGATPNLVWVDGPFVPDPNAGPVLDQEKQYLFPLLKPCPRAGCEEAAPQPELLFLFIPNAPIPEKWRPCLRDPNGTACMAAVQTLYAP